MRDTVRHLACLLAILVALPAGAGSVGVGEVAPSFTLTDWTGKPVAFADLDDRVVCIDFWASWCSRCQEALPALDAAARRHPDVVFLAVNLDRVRDRADEFLRTYLPATAMSLLHDPEGSLLARYGASGMPALYVVDRGGVVRFAAGGYGAGTLDEVERVLAELARR